MKLLIRYPNRQYNINKIMKRKRCEDTIRESFEMKNTRCHNKIFHLFDTECLQIHTVYDWFVL